MINPENKEDYDLVHRYLSGNNQENKDAGQKLFSKIYPQVEAYISSRTFAEEDREVILSDTMYRCIEKLGTFNGSSTFFTFVCGIANYIILEYRRKKQKDSKVVSLDELRESGYKEEKEVLSFYMLPEPYLLMKENLQQVQDALDSISPDHMLIIKLRIFKGLTFKEISVLTKESVEALESRFYRAIKAFKNKL